MADFSTKKISEVYESLMHLDNGSGTASKLSGASTNRVMMDGANVATPINMSTDQVSLMKSTTDSGTPTDQTFVVRTGSGSPGAIWGGVITSYSTGSEGGQMHLKDGNATAKSGANESFWFDNYIIGGQRQMRFYRTDGSANNTRLMTLQEKDGRAYLGIGNRTSPQADLHVEKTIKIGSTLLSEYSKDIYVNASTSGTNLGSDEADGSRYYPYKTLTRALKDLSPYGRNHIHLYAGNTTIGDRTYKITNHEIRADYLSIRAVHPTTGGYLSTSDANWVDQCTHTFIEQATTSDYDGITRGQARWDLYNGTYLRLYGMTINVSFPQGTASAQHHKNPFRMVHGGSYLELGGWNGADAKHTRVKFMNHNYLADGSTVDYGSTALLCVDVGFGKMVTNNVRWEVNSLTNDFKPAFTSGTASLELLQKLHEYPSAIPGLNEHKYTVNYGVTGTSY